MPTLWPFAPNIRQSPYVVSREYRTDIITSRSGREQARALRQTPRKRIEYLTGQTGDCLRAFNRSMVTAQRELLAIPDRVRYVTLAGGLPISNTSVVVDPIPTWIAEGESLIIMGGGNMAFRTVVSIIDTTVIFDESEEIEYPANSRLHPVLEGYLSTTINAPEISPRGVIEVQVSFEVDPGSESIYEDSGTAETTFDGREVFLTRPDKWVPINLTRVQEGNGKVDYGFGRVQQFFPIEFATLMWEASYTGCDFDHSDALRQFFDRMKGRRGEFYMPTWGHDLRPTAALTTAGTTLTVAGTGHAAAYLGSTVWKKIAVRKTNGTWLLRSVTNVVDIAGGATLTITPAWGENVSLSAIDRICWLPIWRFASDILTMTWPRDTVAEIRMPMQMLENLAAE